MTLSFSKYWPDHMPSHLANYRTEFVEQIWAAMEEQNLYIFFREKYQVEFGNRSAMEQLFEEKANYKLNWALYDHLRLNKVFKAHTIRGDYYDRWEPGNDIHFYINVRQPLQFQFAPVVKCSAVQPIEITVYSDLIEVELNGHVCKAKKSPVKNRIYEYDIQLQILAQNDGFKSVEDFFSWFNESSSGKIIHWTKYTY